MNKRAVPYRKASEALKRVLGFFVAKGLLIVPGVEPLPSEKLDVDEVIKFGLNDEPRIIEVLPAALLHFPKSFINAERIPESLKLVMQAISEDLNEGPDLAGISFKAMKRWANRTLPDRRVVPKNKQKVLKSFRLAPDAIARLRAKARNLQMTETQVIETLITKH